MAIKSDSILLAPENEILGGRHADELVQLAFPMQMPDASFAAAVPSAPSPTPLAIRFLEILREEVDANLADTRIEST